MTDEEDPPLGDPGGATPEQIATVLKLLRENPCKCRRCRPDLHDGPECQCLDCTPLDF